MGFSSRSKLEPVEKVAMAEAPPPSKPKGRRGGRRNKQAGGRGRGRKQDERKLGTETTVDDHQARLPGSPSFRYYCDDGVNVSKRRKGDSR
jgi:hypothetical protein